MILPILPTLVPVAMSPIRQNGVMPAASNPKTPRRHHATADTDDKVRRFPPSEQDRAISAEINRQRLLRFVGNDALSKDELAVRAGKSRSHAGRCLADSGPRQAWTISDMMAYAGALGVDLRALLVGAGVIPSSSDSIDVVLSDRSLPDRSARMIVEMIRLARTVEH